MPCGCLGGEHFRLREWHMQEPRGNSSPGRARRPTKLEENEREGADRGNGGQIIQPLPSL